MWLVPRADARIVGMGKRKPNGQKKPVQATVKNPPADKAPVLYIRLSPPLDAALAAYIDRQKAKPDRQAVGVAALEAFLQSEGLWPPPALKAAGK